ncbi:hypothetical protein J3B02_004397 [Coemansia erecta]|nr:hypothetical protein J3B02_004397 [Coemansia erecta]KAJ2871597.1 hypothetical protein FB639_004454 [Coemansia asiatica]
MLSYARRKHTLPDCHPVPRTKFSLDEDRLLAKNSTKIRENPVYLNVKHHQHTQSLVSLRRLCHVFMEPEISHDKQLIFRIFYRNKNQHRGSLYFRRIHELRRALRILDSIKLQEMLSTLLLSFGRQENNTAWTALPCRHFVVQIACRLVDINRLVEKLAEICAKVFAYMQTQVRQTLFMPFSLVIQGLVARMFLVFRVWHKALKDLYALLVNWIPALPACVDNIGKKEEEKEEEDLKHSALVPVDHLLFDPLKWLVVGEKKVAVAENIRTCVLESTQMDIDKSDCEDLGCAVSGKPDRKIKNDKREKKAKRARDLFLDLFE